jgi:hypothetical protein
VCHEVTDHDSTLECLVGPDLDRVRPSSLTVGIVNARLQGRQHLHSAGGPHMLNRQRAESQPADHNMAVGSPGHKPILS